MPQPLGACFGLGTFQFGVAAGDIGPAVMGKVEVAKPLKRQKQDNAAGPADPIVQGGRGKGGAVGAFMFQRKEEDQRNALQRQQRPPARHLKDNQRAEGGNQPQMPGQMPQPRTVRQRGEAGFVPGRQGGDKLFVVHARPIPVVGQNRDRRAQTLQTGTPG